MPDFSEMTYQVQLEDLDAHGRLRVDRLLDLIQHISAQNAEEYGVGQAALEEKGLAWVVVRQRVEIARLPRQHESLKLITWPGRIMHSIFPRYTEVQSECGESLVRTSFLWVIFDKESRTMIVPSQYRIHYDAPRRTALLPLPKLPPMLKAERTADFTVPYRYIDTLGHMHNANYLTLAEDVIPAAAEGQRLSSFVIEFSHEMRLGERLHLEIGREEDHYTISGSREGEPIFLLAMDYRENQTDLSQNFPPHIVRSE